MALIRSIMNWLIRGLTALACRIDYAELEKVPWQGPLLVVANHVNFLEVPLMYTHLLPRPMAGFAKAEAWQNPFLRVLFNLWGAIPLERGEVDRSALRQALTALAEGKIFALAPEGTRSGDGRLRRGLPGVVLLALQSGAPILPVVYYGGEQIFHNLIRLKRTDFHIVVGDLFYLKPDGNRVTGEVRQQMIDEIMYQLAALLPPAYRGIYADLDAATEQYLQFSAPFESNLDRARQG